MPDPTLFDSAPRWFAIGYFLLNILPPGALAVVAVTTLVLFCRDRYRRRVAITPAPEESRIDALLASGAISPEEAAHLRENCNALPELQILAPVPDLPLRLAAAFSRIYAAMILLVFSAFGLFCAVSLFAWGAGNFRMNGNPVWLGLLSLLAIAGALLQWQAARGLLAGNLRARNRLLFLWPLNLCMVTLASSFGSVAVGVAAALTGVWAFWAIALRRDASRKIALGSELSHFARGAALAALLLGLGLGFAAASSDAGIAWTNDYVRSAHSLSYSTGNTIKPRLERLWFIAGSPDQATRQSVELLAGRLRGALKIPVETVPFGTKPPQIDFWREYAFLLTRGTVVKPKEPDLPEPLRQEWRVLLSPINRTLGGATAFQLRGLKSFSSTGSWYHRMLLPSLDFACDSKLAIAANRDQALGAKAAELFFNQLLPVLTPYTVPENTVQIPPIPVELQPQLLTELPGVKNFRCVARMNGGAYRRIEAYAFDRSDYDADRAAVTRALDALKFKPDETSLANGDLRYLAGIGPDRSEALLSMGPRRRPDTIFCADNIDAEFPSGLLILSEVEQHQESPNADFASEFARNDLRGFALSRGLQRLRGREQAESARKFFALPGLSWQEREFVVSDLRTSPTPEMQTLVRDEFTRLCRELAAEPDHLRFARHLQQLTIIIQAPWNETLAEIARTILGETLSVVSVPMPTRPGEAVSASFEFPVADPGNCRKLVEVRFPGSDYAPLWFFFAVAPDNAGTVGYQTNNRSAAGILPGKLAEHISRTRWSEWRSGHSAPFQLHAGTLSYGKRAPLQGNPSPLESSFGIDPQAKKLYLDLSYLPPTVSGGTPGGTR